MITRQEFDDLERAHEDWLLYKYLDGYYEPDDDEHDKESDKEQRNAHINNNQKRKVIKRNNIYGK